MYQGYFFYIFFKDKALYLIGTKIDGGKKVCTIEEKDEKEKDGEKKREKTAAKELKCIKVVLSSPTATTEFYERLLQLVWFSYGMTMEMASNSMQFLKHLHQIENGEIVMKDWVTFPFSGQCKKTALSFIKDSDEAKFFDYQVFSCLPLYQAAYTAYVILQGVK
jgi:hypothetical protein